MNVAKPRNTSNGCSHHTSERIVWPNDRRGSVAVVDPFICTKIRSDGLGSRRNMTAGKPSLLEAHSLSVGSFDRQLRFFPCFPTARNIPQVVKTLTFQNARGDTCPIAAGAVNRRRFI